MALSTFFVQFVFQVSGVIDKRHLGAYTVDEAHFNHFLKNLW